MRKIRTLSTHFAFHMLIWMLAVSAGQAEDAAQEENTLQPALALGNCMSFNAEDMALKISGKIWEISSPGYGSLLKSRAPFGDGKLALKIIRQLKMSEQCIIGDARPAMIYYLSDGKAPTGRVEGEDCVAFDGNPRLSEKSGYWTLYAGRNPIIGGRSTLDHGRSALNAVRKYAFDTVCYVGQPGATMIYFKKQS